MITNKGKDIIAKYMIGQAQAYASYIAIGSGPAAKNSTGVLGNYANKGSLDFEMVRVPIVSRGYVTELDKDGNSVSKVALTAELPTEQRYEVTEVGIYSALANPSAAGKDSKILYTFADSENWEYHNETSASSIPSYNSALDEDSNPGKIIVNGVFRTIANNVTFDNPIRIARNERCRFLNNTLVLPGDMSYLVANSGSLSVKPTDGNAYYGTHIHLAGTNVTLGTNSPNDELKLAFSVINREANDATPEKVMLLIEFASDDVSNPNNYARFNVELTQNLATNRYNVITKKLADLEKSSGFSWGSVNIVRIYASVIKDGVPSSDFFVCLDAMRFENVTSENPLYGLTGYTIIRTADGSPFVKESNSSNMIEFRFGLDVGV